MSIKMLWSSSTQQSPVNVCTRYIYSDLLFYTDQANHSDGVMTNWELVKSSSSLDLYRRLNLNTNMTKPATMVVAAPPIAPNT